MYPSAMTSAEWAEVEPAVRNNAFFSACVEDERVLAALKGLVDDALAEGLSPQEFVRRALVMLEGIRLTPPEDDAAREVFEESIGVLYDPERLRLILRTQEQLASGYAAFCKAFERVHLLLNPGWRFVRQPGAKTKREDHVKHEGAVRLKTDWQFWLARNDPSFGGFGNPYAPFGFNSWMRTFPVSREECEKLGLLKPGETVTIPDALFDWNLPETLRRMGTASTLDLPKDAVDRIIDRCKEEGVEVEPVPGEERVQVVPPPGLDDKLVDAVVDDVLRPQPVPEPTPAPVPPVKPELAPVPVPDVPQPELTPAPEPQSAPAPMPESTPEQEPQVDEAPEGKPGVPRRPHVVQLEDDADGLSPELLGRWPRAVMVTILRNRRVYRRFAARNVRVAEKLGHEETSELEKRWPGYQWTFRVGTDAVLGANPQGCNQYGHGEGCEKKSGHPDGKGLEQSERRKDGENDKESNSGRGGDGSQGGIEDWLQFSGRSGAHHEQGGDEGSGRELGRRVSLSEACRGVLEESARAGEGAQEDVRASDADRRRKVPVDVPGKGMCYTRDCRRHEQRNVKERFSEDDQEVDRRADSRSEEERSGGDVARRGAVSGSEQGADSRDEGELGRRVSLSERCRGVLEESARLLFGEEGHQGLVDELFYPTAAQLNAVVDGRKPAFFEAFEPMMDGLAEAMPRDAGLRYVKGVQGQCIYHPDAVRRVLGTDADGEELDAMVRELIDSGHSGRILGYGYDEFEDPPGRRVRITLNGEVVTGFVVPADKDISEKVAKDRWGDFERAFPGKGWDYSFTDEEEG